MGRHLRARRNAAERRGWIVFAPCLDAGGAGWGFGLCGELGLWGATPNAGRQGSCQGHSRWPGYKAIPAPSFDAGLIARRLQWLGTAGVGAR